MKKILKFTLLFAFALSLQNQIWQNFDFGRGVETIVKVALILTVFELFLKPIIKLLLLPINLLTLGLFRLVINTLGLYLAVFSLSDLVIRKISLPPSNFYGINLPPFNFEGFTVYLVNSITIGLIVSIFKFILKPNKPKK